MGVGSASNENEDMIIFALCFAVFAFFWIINFIMAIGANQWFMKAALVVSTLLPPATILLFLAFSALQYGTSVLADPKGIVLLVQIGLPAAILAGAAAKTAHVCEMARRRWWGRA
ncbi:MAG: hypothetical protein J7493_09430 [Porphyrobacter sp.]|nr:hypothetical protein [Porphyrobacter sp.]